MPRNAGIRGARPVDVHVGARIRLRRNLLGISQMELGDRIGVTFQQVQKYEKGVNRIGSSRLIQICDVLQITPAWLFEDVPGPKPESSPTALKMDAALAAFQADAVAAQLISVWPQLPLRVKRGLVALMSELAERPPATE